MFLGEIYIMGGPLSLLQCVGNRVGVQEAFLRRMAHGATIRTSERSRHDLKGLGVSVSVSTNNILTDDQMLRVCKRFYVALILSRLIQVANAKLLIIFSTQS